MRGRLRRPAVARCASYRGLGVRRSALARRRKQSIVLFLRPHGLLASLSSGAHSRDPLARNDDQLAPIDLGSRTGQRPASTSAMKRSTISLNSAGSSRLSTWPDFGKNREPRRRQVLLQEQARLDAIVVLVAADDQRRRRDASRSRRSGCRSRAGRPGSCAWCWPIPWRRGGPARCRSPRARAGPSAGTESGSAPRASPSPPRPSRSSHIARHWPGTAGGRSRDFRGSSRSRRRRASSTARARARSGRPAATNRSPSTGRRNAPARS